LKVKLELLIVVFCGLAISILGCSLIAGAQTSPSVQPNLREAYSALKVANDAGANVTALATRFNTALALLDNASNGNQTGAPNLISQANSILVSIPTDAQNLGTAARAQRQETARVRTLAIPIGALVTAIIATAFAVVRRNVRARRFKELRVKIKG